MKNIFLLSVIGFLIIPAVRAENHSLSLGYAQSRIEHFKNVRGVNLKYRYETESPVGLIASFSWQSGKNDQSGELSEETSWHSNVKARYWSLLAGPGLRVNKFVSLYALAGVGTVKVNMKDHISDIDYQEEFSDSQRHSGFAWGTGVQFNPMDNVVIDLGYEGSKIDDVKINGFNLGVGYRF